MRCVSWLIWLMTGSVLFASEPADSDVPRDPFWPVGYEKPKPPDPEEETSTGLKAPRPDEVWPELPVQGTSRRADGTFYALIRGYGIAGAGDDVSLEKNGLWYHWRIAEIGPGGIRALKLGVSGDRKTIPRPAAPAVNRQPVKE